MEKNLTVTQLASGVKVIKDYVKTLPSGPGVYRMVNTRGDVLYVGKAKNLKSRVTSYTLTDKMPIRLKRMVAETVEMEFVTTRSEVEALLLESNLIKKFLPRYNILLKDNKSFLYIHIQGDHPWPMLGKHRGAQKRKGWYYGPFASVQAVNGTLTTLHRIFMLRSCSDAVFSARKRPCLQYHIKRCSAPCVGYVSTTDYAKSVKQTRSVLEGKDTQVMTELQRQMTKASACQDYEQAAIIRDRIKALSFIHLNQSVHIPNLIDTDILAVAREAGRVCVQVFFYRKGSNYGNKAFFPQHANDESEEDVLMAFIGQLYQGQTPPRQIVTNIELSDVSLISQALSQLADHAVKVSCPKRGALLELVQNAEKNAHDALKRRLAENASRRYILEAMADRFDLPHTPKRIEVYDNSHISGTSQVGVMVVAGPEGFIKQAYRKFNIKDKNLEPGDDYGMMREVFSRRFKHALEKDISDDTVPDLLIIDGGKGQLSAVQQALGDMGVHNVPMVAIAKGEGRKPGEEKFFMPGRDEFMLDKKDPAFYYIQTLRDEAHRFAIGSHRTLRSKKFKKSLLDDLVGVGPKRKKALLNHFGSAINVSRAGVEDLKTVEGISDALAQMIYDQFNE